MDDPRLDSGHHRRALAGLARLNRVSGSARLLQGGLRDLLPERGGPPLRILDVATGAGDVPIALWRRFRRWAGDDGGGVQLSGCDRSPVAVTSARRRATRAGADVSFFEHDVLLEPLPADFDVIVCSLFLHHLDDKQAVDLLVAMAASAGRRVLINDLERRPLNLGLVWLAAHAVTTSHVVRIDGPRSVRAAFSAPEMARLAADAGLRGARIVRRFPARLLLTWDRPEPTT